MDLSRPNRDTLSAKRMAAAIRAPAVVIPNDYHVGMRVMYYLYDDNSRRSDWPTYVALMEEPDLSEPLKFRIAVKWPWDEKLAANALAKGIHVYVMGAGAVLAHRIFPMRIVDTGSKKPELFELTLSEGPGVIAPEAQQ